MLICESLFVCPFFYENNHFKKSNSLVSHLATFTAIIEPLFISVFECQKFKDQVRIYPAPHFNCPPNPIDREHWNAAVWECTCLWNWQLARHDRHVSSTGWSKLNPPVKPSSPFHKRPKHNITNSLVHHYYMGIIFPSVLWPGFPISDWSL